MKFEGVVPTEPMKLIVPRPTGNGHWKFDGDMGEGVGFVYVIRDLVLKRLYLGKKSYTSRAQGRTTDSNWRSYRSSSNLLKDVFKERGTEGFEFICLEQYRTKGTLSYAETWSLCFVEAPTSDVWYNTRIEKVSWNVKEPITDRHKRRLNMVMNWEKFE